MIMKLRQLSCDFCKYNQNHVNSFGPEEVESKSELREMAREAGWTRIKVPNGAKWDCCPDCKINNPEARP